MTKNNAATNGKSSVTGGLLPTALAGRTIVLVEDEPIEAKRYTKILEKLGATVVQMVSPEDMIEASAELTPPALILTDICGPGKIDGIDLLHRLQQQAQWCRVPALIMTSSPTAERVSGASELPVPPLAFLAKPVGAAKLSELVMDVLSDRSPAYVHRRLARERKAMHMEATSKQRELTRTLAQLMKALGALQKKQKKAREDYRDFVEAFNRASALSPELAGQMRVKCELAQAVSDGITEDIQRADAERTRRTDEKKRHAFQTTKELAAIDERIRSVQSLLKLAAKRKAA